MDKITISKILAHNKKLLPVTNADTGVYVVDIPKVSQILLELFEQEVSSAISTQSPKWVQCPNGNKYLTVNDILCFVSNEEDGCIEADGGGNRFLLAKNEDGSFYVANSMNGYGDNNHKEFASAKVVLLAPIESPSSTHPLQEKIDGLREASGWISVKDRLPEEGQIVDIWEMPLENRLKQNLSLKGSSYAEKYLHDTDYSGWRDTDYKFSIEKDEEGVINCFIKCQHKYLNTFTGSEYKKICVENKEVLYWMPRPTSPRNL